MPKLLKIAASILALATCAACGEAPSGEASSQEKAEILEFFNPFYSLPESALTQSCVIDVQVRAIGEERFLAALDRIAEETGNGIMYSDPTRRDRVLYVAPDDCDNLDKKDAYSPTKYFNRVSNSAKTRASEFPYFVSSSRDGQITSAADLKNAAFAAELEFVDPSNKEEAQRQGTDHFCVINANLRMLSRYGLPLLLILARDNSILYVYNTQPVGEDLVHFLVERGLGECGVKYDFRVRRLNNTESNELSKITVAYQ